MRKKKWIILIITISIISLCLLVGVNLAIRIGLFDRYFKNIAVEELERLLGRKVYVKHVGINFINRFTLYGVRIAQGSDFSEGDFISINKVIINFNFLSFITKKTKLLEALNTITLNRPVFFINNKQGNWNINFPLGSDGKLPLNIKIFIYRGEVLIEDISGKFDKLKFISLNGIIDLSDYSKKQIKLTAKNSLNSNEIISIKADLLNDNFEAELSLQKANIVDYSRFIPHLLTTSLTTGDVSSPASKSMIGEFTPLEMLPAHADGEYKDVDEALMPSSPISRKCPFLTGFSEGLFNLNLSITGSPKHLSSIAYKAKLKIDKAALQIEGTNERISNINGELVLENKILGSNAIFAKLGEYPFVIKGDIVDFTSNPYLNLQVDFENIDYKLLKNVLKSVKELTKLDLLGTGGFSCGIRGGLDSLSIKGTIKIDNGEFLKKEVSNFTAKFQYNNRLLTFLNLTTEIYGGQIFASGTVDFNRTYGALNFDLRGYKVDLVEFLKLDDKQKNIKAKAKLTARIKGDLSSPLIDGEVTFSDLSLAKHNFPSLAGSLKYDKNRVTITTKTDDLKYKVNSLIEIKDKIITVKKFVVSWNKTLIVSQGKLENKNIDLEIITSGLTVEDLPFVKNYYKDLTGKFSFNGKLQGKTDDLSIKGEVISEALLLHKEKIELFFDFILKGGILKIISLKINQTYQAIGNVVFSDKSDSPYLDVEIRAEQGQLYMLPILCQVRLTKEGVDGIVNGNLILKGPLKNLTGSGDIQLERAVIWDNKIEKFQSSFTFYNNELHVTKFILQQNGGKVKGTTQIGLNRQAVNDFKLALNLEKFEFKGILFDGDISLVGKLDYGVKNKANGTLRTSNFTINNQAHQVNAKFDYKGKVLSILPVSTKDDWTLRGEINFQQKPVMDILLNMRKSSVKHVLKLIQVSDADRFGGMLTGYVRFSGLLKNPELIGKLNISEGNFRNFKFDELNAMLLFKDKVLSLKEANGRVKEGRFSVGGQVDFNSKIEQLNLVLEIKQLELKPLLYSYLPELKENIGGRLNGTLAIKNSVASPLIEGNLILSNVSFSEGYKVQRISTDFSFSNRTVNILSLKAEDSGGVIKISEGSNIRIISDGIFSFDLLAGMRNINIFGFSIFGGVYLTGKVDATTPSTQIFADVVTDALWVNQYKFNKAKLSLCYTNNELEFLPITENSSQLIGKMSFKEKNVCYLEKVYVLENKQESLTAKGYIRRDGKVDLILRTRNFNAGIIAGLIGVEIPVKGQTLLNLEIWGRGDNPNLRGNLNIKKGSFGKLKFDNLKIIANAKDNLINLQKLSIELKDKLNISGEGEIPLILSKEAKQKNKNKQINLSLTISKSNLNFLTDLSDQISKASGELKAKLDVKGTFDNPLVSGYVKIEEGKMVSKKIIKSATNIALDIEIVKNKVIINQLSGKIGEGFLNLGGSVKIDSYSFKEFDIEIATSQNVGVDLSIDGFIPKGKPKMRVHIYMDREIYHIDGDIELINTHFTYPPQKNNDVQETDIFEMDFFKNAIWNLEIRAGDNTWYENNLVTANIKGGLKFKGQKENFKVTGKIEAIKGEVQYLGVEFRILQAMLDFQDNIAYLEGSAESKIEDDVITLIIEKTKLKDIKPKFYSQQNPQMTQEKVISLLFYKKDISQQPPEELNKFLVKEMLKLVDTTLGSKIIRPILKEAGLDELVDVVKVKTMIVEKSSSPEEDSLLTGSQVTFGKYLNNRLYVSYTTLFETGLANKLELRHRIELEYRIQGSKFLKMRMDREEKFMGIENQIRF